MTAETHPIDPDHITVGALMKACFNAGQVCGFFVFVPFFFCFFYFLFDLRISFIAGRTS